MPLFPYDANLRYFVRWSAQQSAEEPLCAENLNTGVVVMNSGWRVN